MTFTKDDQDEARTLHAKLNQRLQAWRASQNYETKLAYRLKKDQVRSFWLRHGEDVLAALEEAWERIAELEAERAAMKDSAKPAPIDSTHGLRNEMAAWDAASEEALLRFELKEARASVALDKHENGSSVTRSLEQPACECEEGL